MYYLLQRAETFYYSRRVPEAYRSMDKRDVIRFSLKTRDEKKALRLAIAESEKLELYWSTLSPNGDGYSEKFYQSLVRRAELLGFAYLPNAELANLPLPELGQRLMFVAKEKYNEQHVEAVLGKVQEPILKLDQAIEHYFEIAKDKTFNKSFNQIRKWQNPRKKAMANLIALVGNKAIKEFKREDALKFRDWWITRITNENLSADSANRDLINIKTIITTVADNFKIGLNAEHIFKNLLLKNENEETRPPFERSHIVSVLLNADKLKDLNEQASWALHAFAETGAGFKELTGLMPEDIILDHEIPHIIIRPRRLQSLKTRFRKRVIPLVGFALDAFKACPQGFTRYFDKSDSLSTLINKYLTNNGMLPSDEHSAYSLRHSFQDRLLAVNTPDRIQADLMGHKFSRPRYGEGATLAHKLEWLLKAQLKTKKLN